MAEDDKMQDEKLLGDKIEEALNAVGADKLAKAYERITKKPCGCQKRKESLNNLDRTIRKIGQSRKMSDVAKEFLENKEAKEAEEK